MDALRLADEIEVQHTDNDAPVGAMTLVQGDEELSVERHHGAAVCASESNHFDVGYGLTATPGLMDREHVVAEAAEFLDDGHREVLVCV